MQYAMDEPSLNLRASSGAGLGKDGTVAMHPATEKSDALVCIAAPVTAIRQTVVGSEAGGKAVLAKAG